VEPRPKAFVVAGGPSLTGFNFKKLDGHFTIAVNRAAYVITEPAFFVTMDYSFLMKTDYGIRQLPNATTKVFVAALDVPYLVEEKGRILDKRSNMVYDLRDFDMIVKSRKRFGVGRRWNDFRSGWNSGFCGFQLAVMLGFKEIVLLGFDLTATVKTHFHQGYGEPMQKFAPKLDDYLRSFEMALDKAHLDGQVVYNCSKISRLRKFIGYRDIKDLL